MNITLECHYCGNGDNKMSWEQFGKLAQDPTAEIKCKCGKWLLKDGNLGHKHTETAEYKPFQIDKVHKIQEMLHKDS